MKLIFFVCIGLCCCKSTVYSQVNWPRFYGDYYSIPPTEKSIDTLITIIKNAYYYNDVRDAKEVLGIHEYKIMAIPKILPMLYDTRKSVLEKGDPRLFFANGNFGHDGRAGIIPYNIDWLSIRAGWLIEAFTSKDFGYSSQMVDEVINNYGTHKVTWEKIATKESLQADRKKMADKVSAWWKTNGANWIKSEHIKDSLESN